MSNEVVIYLVGGFVFMLAAALVVVVIARGMDRGGAPLASKSGASPAAPVPRAAAGAAAIKMAFGAAVAEKIAKAQQASAMAPRKRIGIAVSGASVAIVIGAIAALAKDRDNAQGELPTPVEINAGALHGTLLSPRENAPVVLIVPGSGPTDRDGNSPLGIKAGMYKLLAEGLAQEGISSVRVDKRGMFGSAAAGNPNAVSVNIYAQDYRAWIDAIREKTGRKCVWLLGHSEGALMVSAAAEGRKDVCGLILVSGMGRKMGDVLREQLQANPANAPLLGQAFAAISELEAGRRPDSTNMHPALMPLFAPPVQDFLISVFSTDPVEAVRRARVKTLVVQGTTDLQVTVEDAKLLNKAPKTKLERIKGMNHVLKEAPTDRAANMATYANPDLPLAPRLAGVIEDFIEDDD